MNSPSLHPDVYLGAIISQVDSSVVLRDQEPKSQRVEYFRWVAAPSSDRRLYQFDRVDRDVSVGSSNVDVREKIKGVFGESLTDFQQQILRWPSAKVSAIELALPKIRVQKADMRSGFKPKKLNKFGKSLEPIITPEGRYIYSARKYTPKQRQKMYERMERSRRPLKDSWSGRVTRFFQRKPNYPDMATSDMGLVSNLSNLTFEIVDFELRDGTVFINLSNERSLSLHSFLYFYTVNSPEVAELVTKAKNLCFQGVCDNVIVNILRDDLEQIKRDSQALCVDTDSLNMIVSQKEAESQLDSGLAVFFRSNSDEGCNIVCGRLEQLLETADPQIVTDPKKFYQNYIKRFLFVSMKGLALNDQRGKFFGCGNFLSRGWRAMRGGDSLLKEFSYWLREYAFNPTDTACINMYNFYLQKFMTQVEILIDNSKESPERVLVAYCRQVLNYIKK